MANDADYQMLTPLDQWNTLRGRLLEAERQHFDADWNVQSLEFSQIDDAPDTGLAGQIEYQKRQKAIAERKIDFLRERIKAFEAEHPEVLPENQ